ncbi:MAG: hypothetical protein QF363_03160 [Planctomycetaceae bacterium]|nr:hypothetical protein [Planctomycetaceae bacterium]
MTLRMGPGYAALVDRARSAHAAGRNPASVGPGDIGRARLYCYGFRGQVIGGFHATRVVLEQHVPVDREAVAWRKRTVDALADLADLAMDAVPNDYRAVLSTFHHYDCGVRRVLESLDHESEIDSNPHVTRSAALFRTTVESVSGAGGLTVTQDTHAPEQASFVVPNLGIVIVPLVYGDFHSWNLAWLAGEERNVPTHQHERGVEIHLGYQPTHGQAVLGESRCECDEGYAMPIPPMTAHGWVNTSETPHHVPFIFGSLDHGGWGVFLDVQARTEPVNTLELVERDSPAFGDMVYLERELDRMAGLEGSERSVLIPHTATNRDGSGGLELAASHVGREGLLFHGDLFRIVSVARGSGRVRIANFEQSLEPHDHFGIPAEMPAELIPTGDAPLVVLDATIHSN